MSLIVTQISKYGIVVGSDSNLTSVETGKVSGEGNKVFPIPKLQAAMCIAGSYSIGNEKIRTWIPKFIKEKANEYATPKEFAKLLSDTAVKTMSNEEKESLLIAQIGAYQNGQPEMWVVSNADATGDGYTQRDFDFGEDFQRRDRKAHNTDELFESKGLNYFMYFQAREVGRLTLGFARQAVDDSLKKLWEGNESKFRPPNSLDDQEEVVRSYLDLVRTMFIVSDYPNFIGGGTQTLCVSIN